MKLVSELSSQVPEPGAYGYMLCLELYVQHWYRVFIRKAEMMKKSVDLWSGSVLPGRKKIGEDFH